MNYLRVGDCVGEDEGGAVGAFVGELDIVGEDEGGGCWRFCRRA